MGQQSPYLKRKMLNAAVRGIDFTAPKRVYLAAFLVPPSDGDAGVEVNGNGYARCDVEFAAPSLPVGDQPAATSNVREVSFPLATPRDWGEIAALGVMDAPTGGHLLYVRPLIPPVAIHADDQLRFGAGKITVREG